MSANIEQRPLYTTPANLPGYLISLEQAQTLFNLGIHSPSLFAWVESRPGSFEPVPAESIAGSSACTPAHYSAYSLQEMLSLLPPTVNVPLKSGTRSKFDHMLFYGLLPGKEKHFVKCTTANKAEFRTVDQSLSGACFKMLLYLIENRLYAL